MTPADIANKRFEKGVTGYKVDDVNSYLEKVSFFVEDILGERDDLVQKLEVLAEKIEEYREDEDSLRAAIIGAQKLGDSVIKESKHKAEMIVAEARKEAENIRSSANARIEAETFALNKMKVEVTRFKNQILNLYKQQMELINALPEVKGAFDVRTAMEQDAEGNVQLIAEEIDEEESLPAEEKAPEKFEAFPKKRRSKYGELKFGDNYTLSRNE